MHCGKSDWSSTNAQAVRELTEKGRRYQAMLLTLCMIAFTTRSPEAASLGYGNMQIEGTGTISPDHTSVDIHFDTTNVKEPQPSTLTSFSTKPAALPVAMQPNAHVTQPHPIKDTWYQQDKPSFGVETAEEFLKSALESHNRFRAIHNSPPLKLNLKMSREAEEFAKKLFQRGAKNQPMMHEDELVLQKEDEGENLAAGGSILGGLTARGAVKNWYNEVCTYNWGQGGYKPQAAHFMQVIWKNSTEFGIGKAEGKKNGRRYTYIVARYKPAITYDTLKNVLKGKFNPSYCRPKPRFSLSDGNQNKPSTKVRPMLAERFPKQPGYTHKKPAILRPLRGRKRQPLARPSLNLRPGASYKPNDAKYNYGYLKTTAKTYPYRQSHQNDKLSYYAGNSWGTNTGNRLSTTSSEYYPKQAEVLEEFIEGDDPEKAKYEQSAGKYGVKESMNQSLIPVMNSVDAEIDDDPSEYELATKTHVPRRS